MKIYDFRIEYREQPKGLAVKIPRFSWKIASGDNNVVQTAWHLIVSSAEKCFWDSGKIESDQSVLVPYAGQALTREQEYQVSLEIWDNYGNRAKAETAFTTGIFDTGDFQAKMITHDFPPEEMACPVFFRKFSPDKEVSSACLYATALGVYEITLNGKRVEDYYMAPGWTNYHKILQYQYYDVTDRLQGTGQENVLELTVGNGWYKGILSFDCKPDRYGDRTAVWAELHVRYTDGTEEVITTDETWHVRTGQIRYSEIYMGETIDTNAPNIREGKVSAVPEAVFHPTVLTPQLNEPVRVTERLKAKRVFTDSKGNILVDFGQNLTGLVEIRIRGEKGQKITVRHAETLDQDGVFYPDTLRTAKSEDTYILNGEEQVLMPHFTFHGFRYAAVEGIENPRPEMFTACVTHSDMRKTGEFRCSNEKVNQLQSNISWSLRDNFFDIPTVLKGMSGLDGWEMRRYSHGQQRSTGRRLCFLQNG